MKESVNLKGKKLKYGGKNQQGSRDTKATATNKKEKQQTNENSQPTNQTNRKSASERIK